MFDNTAQRFDNTYHMFEKTVQMFGITFQKVDTTFRIFSNFYQMLATSPNAQVALVRRLSIVIGFDIAVEHFKDFVRLFK